MSKQTFGPFRFMAAVETIAEAALPKNPKTPTSSSKQRSSSVSTPPTRPSSRESFKSSSSARDSKRDSRKEPLPKHSLKDKWDGMFNPESWANCALEHETESTSRSIELELKETASHADTEVATNRAVDLAMKRIQEMDAEADYIVMQKVRDSRKKTHPTIKVGLDASQAYRRTVDTRSIISASSCGDETDNFEAPAVSTTPPATSNPSRHKLQDHLQRHDPPLGPIDWQNASLSSSVGVEIHANRVPSGKNCRNFSRNSTGNSFQSMARQSQDSDRTQFDTSESIFSFDTHEDPSSPPSIKRVQPVAEASRGTKAQTTSTGPQKFGLSSGPVSNALNGVKINGDIYSRPTPSWRSASSLRLGANNEPGSLSQRVSPPSEDKEKAAASRICIAKSSFSVKNIREAFESVAKIEDLPSAQALENDDDSVSVQSVRDKSEVVKEIKQVGRVQQMKALFERNGSPKTESRAIKAAPKTRQVSEVPISGQEIQKTVSVGNLGNNPDQYSQLSRGITARKSAPNEPVRPKLLRPVPVKPIGLQDPVLCQPKSKLVHSREESAEEGKKSAPDKSVESSQVTDRIAMFNHSSVDRSFQYRQKSWGRRENHFSSLVSRPGTSIHTILETDEKVHDEIEEQVDELPDRGAVDDATENTLKIAVSRGVDERAQNIDVASARPDVLSDNYSAADSDNESTETDGVTLEVSVAEISNLTNPTALISVRTADHREDDHSFSSKSKVAGSESRPSEASSSQPSEAALPLLSRVLRSKLLSDEVSATDSFVAARASVARRWTPEPPHAERAAVEEEKKECSEAEEHESVGWDVTRVEQIFPEMHSTAGDMFEFDSKWQQVALKSPPPSASSSVGSAFKMKNESFDSRSSSTPPRGNKSLSTFKPDQDALNRQYFVGTTRRMTTKPESVGPQPVDGFYVIPQANSESPIYRQFMRKGSIPEETCQKGFPEAAGETGLQDSELPSKYRHYSQEQAAVRARLQRLRDARIRRAAAFGYSPALVVSSGYDDPVDEASLSTMSYSTMSSTRHGGSVFEASLMELD